MSTPTPRTKPIDLSKCKVGQRVRLRNKLVVIFTGKSTCTRFPFKYEHPDHGDVTVTTCGQVLTSCTAPEDIIAIIPVKKAKNPAKKANTLERFTDAFAKIAFKGDNDLIRKAADQLEGLLKP